MSIAGKWCVNEDHSRRHCGRCLRSDLVAGRPILSPRASSERLHLLRGRSVQRLLRANLPRLLAMHRLLPVQTRKRVNEQDRPAAVTEVRNPPPGFFNARRCVVLVLSRKKNERILIGDDIVVTVADIRADKVRIGIEAPREMPIHRAEVHKRIAAEQGEKDESC